MYAACSSSLRGPHVYRGSLYLSLKFLATRAAPSPPCGCLPAAVAVPRGRVALCAMSSDSASAHSVEDTGLKDALALVKQEVAEDCKPNAASDVPVRALQGVPGASTAAQMQIRPAIEGDLPAILAIEQQNYSNGGGWEQKNFTPLLRFTFVGTINGTLKGYVIPVKLLTGNVKTLKKSAGLLLAEKGKPEGRKKDTLYISNIAVDEDSRGKGYGTLLAEHALKHVSHKYLRWTAPSTEYFHVLHKVALARKYESLDGVAGKYVVESKYDGSNETAYRYVFERPDASNAEARKGRKRKRE